MNRKMTPPYDAWLNWNVLCCCNLDCAYCSNYDVPQRKKGPTPPIKIDALMKTLEKTKKTFIINFSGVGETFLVPNIVEACAELTKKHFITFNSNLTTNNFREFTERVNLEKVNHIMASCHIKELEKKNLIERYIDNYLHLKSKGIKVHAVEVAYPPLLPEVEKYKNDFKDRGINLEFGAYVGKYNGKNYPEEYTEEEITTFGFPKKQIERHFQQRTLCNAGQNIAIVCHDGKVLICDQLRKEIGHIYEKIEFQTKPTKCPFSVCRCPLKDYDSNLFQKALMDSKLRIRFKNKIKNILSN